MKLACIDKQKFGSWALVTGASAGIGKEFARQLAAQGFKLVIAARRLPELEALADELVREHGVECRSLKVNFTDRDPLATIVDATRELDIGLVVSNAGTGVPGEFLSATRHDLHAIVRLNVVAHLDLAHHFGRRLAARGGGGLLLVGALGARGGIPYMANAGATKAFVQSLGEALHVELAPHGVHVTVLVPGPTDTPVLEQFGIAPDELPIRPLSAEQCVFEGLRALESNQASVVPGALTRFMHSMVPESVSRRMMATMFARGLAAKR